MTSAIALLLCTIFVFFLLRIDRKQFPDASIYLWVPTVWILITFSKPLGVWFQSGGSTMEEGSALDRIVLSALLCLGIITLVKRKFNWSNAIRENIWLILLLSYCFISCLWSDIPFISFKRSIRDLTAITMAFLVASETEPKKSLESIFRRTIYILIPFSYLLINYYGQYGRMYLHHDGALMWVGVTLHKNQLCQLCLFSVFFLIWANIKRFQEKGEIASRYHTYLDVIILILTFWIMIGPQHSFFYSATSTVSLIVGLLVFIWIYRQTMKTGASSNQKIVFLILRTLIIFVIIYGTVTPFLGKLSIIDFASFVGRDQTLTGRTEIWERLVPAAMSRPFFGYGNGGFWTTGTREMYAIMSSHNGYLEVILELGFVGLTLYAIFFLSIIRKAILIMNQDFYWGSYLTCFLFMVVVHNITEVSMSSLSGVILTVLLFVSVAAINKPFVYTIEDV